jgi:hypothetical protein
MDLSCVSISTRGRRAYATHEIRKIRMRLPAMNHRLNLRKKSVFGFAVQRIGERNTTI